jgi:hypothetical protein
MEDMSRPDCRRDLGGGFVARWSTASNAEDIAQLCGHVFRRKADDPPNPWVMAWVRNMMGGSHPHIGPGDYALVEDTTARRIVSGACLLSYQIEFEGLQIPFGRPEAVFTHPDFRNRGFVRALFGLLHARSAAKGHLVQGITGIPYYYKLFGYEYAADLGGEVSVYFAAIPRLAGGEKEPYRLRRAAQSEWAAAKALYDQDRGRYALSTPIEEGYWSWLQTGQSAESGEGWVTRFIVDADDAPVGYVMTSPVRDADEIKVLGLGVRGGMNLGAVMPSVLRGLESLAGEPVPKKKDLPAPARVRFALWRDHPAYSILGEKLSAGRMRPYAWYLRVPDPAGFLLRIRGVLEARLAASPFAGYTGELRLSFYRNGLRLVFDRGRLASVEDWREDHAWGPDAQAGFPPLVFLKLLFGHRSLTEIIEAYPDARANDEVRPLLEALFPRRPTWLIPLD